MKGSSVPPCRRRWGRGLPTEGGTSFGGAGGGGGWDVRLGGTDSPCASSRTCGYGDRIIAAGGGGGGSGQGVNGGTGGGSSGADSTTGDGTGGTQEKGGGNDCTATFDECGAFGNGGQGSVAGSAGGGGGGGWFGGGGGATQGGGGGSGFVNALSLRGSFLGGTRSGDGKVVIRTP